MQIKMTDEILCINGAESLAKEQLHQLIDNWLQKTTDIKDKKERENKTNEKGNPKAPRLKSKKIEHGEDVKFIKASPVTCVILSPDFVRCMYLWGNQFYFVVD